MRVNGWARVTLALALTAGAAAANAAGPGLYLGITGGLVAGSLFLEDSGSEASFAGKAADTTFGVFGGVRLPIAPGFSAAIEADYQFGDVSVAEASSGAVQASVVLRDVWSLSVMPTLHLDDKAAVYLRAGVGRGTLAGTATDGTVRTSGEERFTMLRGGLGMSYALDPNVLLRLEYVYSQGQKEDGVQPTSSAVHLGVAYVF